MKEPAESRVCRLPLTAGSSQVVVALARPGTGPRWQEASTCLPTPVTVRLPARRPPLPRTCRPPAEDSEPPGWRRLLNRSHPQGNFQWNSLKTNEWTVPWFLGPRPPCAGALGAEWLGVGHSLLGRTTHPVPCPQIRSSPHACNACLLWDTEGPCSDS